LTWDELKRRESAMLTFETSTSTDDYDIPAPFSLREEDAKELSKRLQVNESIISFNANRLRVICLQLLGTHEYFRRKVLLCKDGPIKERTLNSKEMALLLEFFLQIDGNFLLLLLLFILIIIDFLLF